MPVSRWSMKFQVITEAKTGSAYGMRNRVRTAPRPRNARCVKTAADMPNSQHTARTTTEYRIVTVNECSSADPVAEEKFTAIA